MGGLNKQGEEKKMWNKDTGRMYAHNIISWHKDEQITPEQAFEFGKEFAENWFSGFQTLVAVHKDKDHIHCHLVTNSVSYEDGRKLHNTKKDLERMPAGFREEIKSLAQKKGGVLEISGETRNIDGGFILIYGGIEENCSIDAMFAGKRDELLDQVRKILFA